MHSPLKFYLLHLDANMPPRRPPVVSISYGLDEKSWTVAQANTMCQAAKQLTALGTTIVVRISIHATPTPHNLTAQIVILSSLLGIVESGATLSMIAPRSPPPTPQDARTFSPSGQPNHGHQSGG